MRSYALELANLLREYALLATPEGATVTVEVRNGIEAWYVNILLEGGLGIHLPIHYNQPIEVIEKQANEAYTKILELFKAACLKL